MKKALKRKKQIIILHALLNGGHIKKDGRTLVLDNLYNLCEVQYSSEKRKKLLKVNFDCSLKEFLDFCDTFSEKETAIVCVQTLC